MKIQIAGLVVLVGLILQGCGKTDIEKMEEKATGGRKDLRALIEPLATTELKIWAKVHMKDPDSVQFTALEYHDVYYKKGTTDGRDAPSHFALCGLMNAKNSYGGYTGYRRFISAGRFDWKAKEVKTEYFYLDDDEADYKKASFNKMEKMFCATRDADQEEADLAELRKQR